MNDSTSNITLLRHTLATIQYRANSIIRDIPEGYDRFELSEGTRTPTHLLSHMSDVLSFAIQKIDPENTSRFPADPDDWLSQVNRFSNILNEADTILVKRPVISEDTTHRLLQGPLADTLTHVGQLAMLRRCAGDPVPGENFFEATINPINPEES